MKLKFGLFCVFLCLISSCTDEPVPKPRAYFRIEMPEKDYRRIEPDCPFSFEIPAYSQFQYRKEYCWFNLNFPLNKAQVHFTYKPLENNLRQLLEESHQMSYEHHVKASDIQTELVLREEKRVFGLIYHLTGDVASPVQFYLTDSTNHFLRGSLYFNSHINRDSLDPVISNISEDIDHLVRTLEWK
jgi:gliding motility-associated lipoprotein GldD